MSALPLRLWNEQIAPFMWNGLIIAHLHLFPKAFKSEEFSSLLFKITSPALPWNFYFFKLTQLLAVSSVHYCTLSRRKEENLIENHIPFLPPRNLKSGELSRLCQEFSKKLYVHEFGFWSIRQKIKKGKWQICSSMDNIIKGTVQRKFRSMGQIWYQSTFRAIVCNRNAFFISWLERHWPFHFHNTIFKSLRLSSDKPMYESSPICRIDTNTCCESVTAVPEA
jgi:hypothetical protein